MIEVNGAANIIMEIEVAERIGRPVNIDLIKRQAQYINFYLRLIAERGTEKNPNWYQACRMLDEKLNRASDETGPIQFWKPGTGKTNQP